MIKKSTLTLILILFAFVLKGQPRPIFYNYSVDEGLPSSETYELIQDAYGYIWIATDRGVVRFDGYEFDLFTKAEGLNSNVIFKMDEGKDGEIWFLSNLNQISIFKDGKILDYQHNPKILAFHDGDKIVPNSLIVDSTNRVVITYSKHKAMAINASGETEQILGGQNFYTIHDEPNALYAVWSYGPRTELPVNLTYRKPGEEYFKIPFIFPGEEVAAFKTAHTKLCKLSNGDIYFTHNSAIMKLSANKKLSVFWEFDHHLYSLKSFNDELYAGLELGGLVKINPTDSAIVDHFVKDHSVSDMIYDESGGFWISTLKSGVIYFPPTNTFKMEGVNEAVLNIECQDDFIYYISEEGKLKVLDKENNYESKSTQLSSYASALESVVIDGEEKVIVSLFTDLPFITSNDLERSNFDHHYLSRQFMKRDSVLYALGEFTLYVIDTEKSTVHRRLTFNDHRSNRAFIFYEDGIVIATTEGVWYHTLSSEPGVPFRQDIFKGFYCTDVDVLRDSIVVASTKGDGLVISTPSNFMQLRKKDGLVSDEIDKIKTTDEKIILSSRQGISIVTTGTAEKPYHISNYHVKNGLVSNEIHDFDLHNDELWIATGKGISVIDLREFEPEEPYKAPFYITGVWIENEQVGVENNYILGSEEDEIHIKYVCVDHKQGGRIKYRYRMTGVDDFWNTTMDRELTYRSIPYGKHKLYMSYQMSDGNWSTQIPVLHINRYPPFYMQIWFYFSLAGLITLSIYLLQRRSHQKKLRKKDMQLMIAELERQAYQSQMNPHFIFNAMNTIQSFISQAENRKAEMYLSKFSRLVRAALNHSELKFVSLEEEMEIISMYLEIEMMRFPEKFRYVIKTDDRLDPMEVKIPPMIIQPFVENSIVHGLLKKETAGFLKIKLDYFDHRFVMVTIEDNGVGRKKASAYKLSKYESKGIKITQARLLLLDAESKIEIIDLEEKGTARGTRVNLKIPIKND